MAAESTADETLLAMQLQAAEVDRVIQESADFELAFEMQLAEALRVSAAAGPSSSTSLNDNDSDDPMEEGEERRVGAVAAVGEDRQVAMTEQKREMNQLNQEMEDEVIAMKEQSRLEEIEAITKHDARFARFLATVPASEWTNKGENLTDPFTFTQDQTSVSTWKGKAPIGCERPTNVSMWKGKAPIGCERPTKGMNLGSASSSVICQSDMWEPAVAAAFLLNADNVDNKSYLATINEGFHVDRRENVEPWQCGTSEGDGSSNCGICMEAVMSSHNSVVVSDECMHRFCTECLRKHAETAVKSGKSYITCPEFHCETLWSVKMSESLLSSNTLLMLTQRQIEDAIPESERVYCPFRDCSALQLTPELPSLPTTSGHPHKTAVGGVECYSCSRYFCLECQVPWHGDLTCEDFQNLPRSERSAEDLSVKDLAKQKKWQRCKKCGHIVELVSGCHHINCRCGYDFCYTCGGSWAAGHLCQV